MYRKRRERNRNKRGRAGGKLGRFVSEEEESDSFIEAYLAEVENAESEDEEDAEDTEEDAEDMEAEDAKDTEAEDAEFLIERSDEVELWPWEENEEEAREDKAPALNSYQNRTCRRTGYREEVGRQRNAWMKGKWKWKKR